MPINQDEPSFEKLTKRERELIGLRRSEGPRRPQEILKEQIQEVKRGSKKRSQGPAEWE